jgi:hypothetical protein
LTFRIERCHDRRYNKLHKAIDVLILVDWYRRFGTLAGLSRGQGIAIAIYLVILPGIVSLVGWLAGRCRRSFSTGAVAFAAAAALTIGVAAVVGQGSEDEVARGLSHYQFPNAEEWVYYGMFDAPIIGNIAAIIALWLRFRRQKATITRTEVLAAIVLVVLLATACAAL